MFSMPHGISKGVEVDLAPSDKGVVLMDTWYVVLCQYSNLFT